MPYIKQEKRSRLDPLIESLLDELVKLDLDDPENVDAGNVNYIITKILDRRYGNSSAKGYRDINEACGILTTCLLEYYRRVAAPIEEQKRYENDDVYGS
jgi:hypothetical protein